MTRWGGWEGGEGGGCLRGVDANSLEELRVEQRQLDRFTNLPDLLAQAADHAVVHLAWVLRKHVVHHRIHLWLNGIECAPQHTDSYLLMHQTFCTNTYFSDCGRPHGRPQTQIETPHRWVVIVISNSHTGASLQSWNGPAPHKLWW